MFPKVIRSNILQLPASWLRRGHCRHPATVAHRHWRLVLPSHHLILVNSMSGFLMRIFIISLDSQFCLLSNKLHKHLWGRRNLSHWLIIGMKHCVMSVQVISVLKRVRTEQLRICYYFAENGCEGLFFRQLYLIKRFVNSSKMIDIVKKYQSFIEKIIYVSFIINLDNKSYFK